VKIGSAEGITGSASGVATTCYWIAAGGGCLFIGSYYAALVAERVSYIFNDWWLASWTTVSSGDLNNTPSLQQNVFLVFGSQDGFARTEEAYYMYGYSSIVCRVLCAVPHPPAWFPRGFRTHARTHKMSSCTHCRPPSTHHHAPPPLQSPPPTTTTTRTTTTTATTTTTTTTTTTHHPQ
jgi:hypothetical protein